MFSIMRDRWHVSRDSLSKVAKLNLDIGDEQKFETSLTRFLRKNLGEPNIDDIVETLTRLGYVDIKPVTYSNGDFEFDLSEVDEKTLDIYEKTWVSDKKQYATFVPRWEELDFNDYLLFQARFKGLDRKSRSMMVKPREGSLEMPELLMINMKNDEDGSFFPGHYHYKDFPHFYNCRFNVVDLQICKIYFDALIADTGLDLAERDYNIAVKHYDFYGTYEDFLYENGLVDDEGIPTDKAVFHPDAINNIARRVIGRIPYSNGAVARPLRIVFRTIMPRLLSIFREEYNVQLMETLEKDRYSSYATSYETKKNIPKYIQEAMKNSPFLKSGFRFVEYDELSDLKKLETVYQSWVSLQSGLPQTKSQPELRFRRLGKRSARGTYYPHVDCIAVDIRTVNSFVHEYGHHLDYTWNEFDSKNQNFNPLSMQPEFKDILDGYQSEISRQAKDDVKIKRKLSYYQTPTEVFARAFEIHIFNECPTETVLGKTLSEFVSQGVYNYFLKNKTQITKYFNSIFGELNFRGMIETQKPEYDLNLKSNHFRFNSDLLVSKGFTGYLTFVGYSSNNGQTYNIATILVPKDEVSKVPRVPFNDLNSYLTEFSNKGFQVYLSDPVTMSHFLKRVSLSLPPSVPLKTEVYLERLVETYENPKEVLSRFVKQMVNMSYGEKNPKTEEEAVNYVIDLLDETPV